MSRMTEWRPASATPTSTSRDGLPEVNLLGNYIHLCLRRGKAISTFSPVLARWFKVDPSLKNQPQPELDLPGRVDGRSGRRSGTCNQVALPVENGEGLGL